MSFSGFKTGLLPQDGKDRAVHCMSRRRSPSMRRCLRSTSCCMRSRCALTTVSMISFEGVLRLHSVHDLLGNGMLRDPAPRAPVRSFSAVPRSGQDAAAFRSAGLPPLDPRHIMHLRQPGACRCSGGSCQLPSALAADRTATICVACPAAPAAAAALTVVTAARQVCRRHVWLAPRLHRRRAAAGCVLRATPPQLVVIPHCVMHHCVSQSQDQSVRANLVGLFLFNWQPHMLC